MINISNKNTKVMQKQILIILLIFSVLSSYSQVYLSKNTDVAIGVKANGDSIKAVQYIFDGEVWEMEKDSMPSAVNFVLIHKNKRGKYSSMLDFVRFFADSAEKSFQIPFRYGIESVYPFDDVVVRSQKGTYVYNRYNGAKFWDRYNFAPLILKDNILVGVNLMSEKIVAYNLVSKKKLWKRKFRLKDGVKDFYMLDDSTLMIYGAGIYTYNIYTGEGYDFKAKTAVADYTKAAIATTVGVALAVTTGYGFYSTGPDYTTPIGSQPLFDNQSNDLFFASYDFIYRISDTGQVVWQKEFPAKTVSYATLFQNDSLVFMLNYGYSYKNRKFVYVGVPFVAAYDKKTGERKFLLNTAEAFTDYQVINDTILYLLSGQKVLMYNLKIGKRIKTINFESSIWVEQLRGFYDDTLYSFSDGEVVCYDNSRAKLIDNKNTLVLIDTKGVYDAYDEGFYVVVARYKNYKFLDNDEKIVILDNANNKIGSFEFLGQIVIKDDKLFYINDESLYIVDLQQFK